MLRRTFLALALLAAAAACSGKKGTPVAKGGGVVITAEELKQRLDEQSPMIRQSLNSPERKKQFLDSMIRFELLAKAAEKEGLDKDPEVQLMAKKAMVSKYYQRFFQGQDAAKSVTDAEVQKYFDEHKDEFHRPARVHALHVFFAAEKPADRPKQLAKAKKALEKILSEEKDKKLPTALSNAARDLSDDASSKNTGGDLGFRTQDELERIQGKEVAAAVFALPENTTSAQVVESPKGFHLVRTLQKQPEFNRTVEEAKPQIAARLGNQKRSKEFDDLVKKLREDANVKVDDAALDKVVVSGPPGAPGAPGFPGPGAMTPRPAPLPAAGLGQGQAVRPAGPAPVPAPAK